MEKFGPFFPNVMQAYIRGSAATVFANLATWYGAISRTLSLKRNYRKNPLSTQMDNFSTIVPQYYAALYIRIYTKDFSIW